MMFSLETVVVPITE